MVREKQPEKAPQRINGPRGNALVHKFGDPVACLLRIRDARDVIGAFDAEEKRVTSPASEGGDRTESVPASYTSPLLTFILFICFAAILCVFDVLMSAVGFIPAGEAQTPIGLIGSSAMSFWRNTGSDIVVFGTRCGKVVITKL